VIVGGLQAGPVSDRTVDIDRGAAAAADEMVMVVVDPSLVASGGARRLDPPDEALVGQGAQCVVDRLTGDGPDLGPHEVLDLACRCMRPACDHAQNGQTLCRHLNTVLTEYVSRVLEVSP
jgi:hypothetical protein